MILFLGSGVSLASGLPSVAAIQEALLSDVSNPTIVRFLKTLIELDSDYLQHSAPSFSFKGNIVHTGQIYRTQTTYEDLFYLASQVVTNGEGLKADLNAEALTQLLCKHCKSFLNGETLDEKKICLHKLCNQNKYFIENTVANLLKSDQIVGLDLVLELAKSKNLQHLNIVTLNHDILVEQVLTQHQIAYTDGFVTGEEENLRIFKDFYAESEKIKVLKPHGSVSWWRRGGSQVVQSEDIFNPNLRLGRCPSFLTGVGKINSYNQGIFADQHFRFVECLRNNCTIVMSGYGWADLPYNFQFLNWLNKRAENRLILLHQNPEALAESSLELTQVYNKYVKDGKIIPIRKWLSDTNLSELSKYLPPTRT